MKRKLIFSLFFICLLLSFMAVCVNAASGFEAIISTDYTGEMRRGDTFTVTVNLTKNPGYFPMILQMEYDHTVLEVVKTTYNEDFGITIKDKDGNSLRQSSYSDNIIELQVINRTENETVNAPDDVNNKPLCTATFLLKSDAPFYVHADVDVSFTFYTDNDGILSGPNDTYDIVRNADFDLIEGDHQDHLIICSHPSGLDEMPYVEPNCKKDGTVHHFYCSSCDKAFSTETGASNSLLETTVIPKTPDKHTLPDAPVPANPSNCVHTGTVEYYQCPDCGKYFADAEAAEEISDIIDPLKPHDITHHPLDPAECLTPGTIEYYTCSVCGQMSETGTSGWKTPFDTTIPMLGHDTVLINAKQATTREEGYTGDEYCRRCKQIITFGEDIPKKSSGIVITPSLITYRVTFVTGIEGMNEVEWLKMRSGSKLNLDAFIPERPGYEFAGWYTDEARTKPVSGLYRITRTTRLYADWKPLPSFVDVPFTSLAYEDVKFVYQQGLMIGVSDTEFAPEATGNRAMMATILYRLFGAEANDPTAYPGTFTDVPAAEWYTAGVNWAAAKGIYQGYGDGTFQPLKPITHEELLTIVHRYAAMSGITVPTTPYEGEITGAADWSAEAVRWTVEAGLLEAAHPMVLLPQENATRAQIASILHRLHDTLEAARAASGAADGLE